MADQETEIVRIDRCAVCERTARVRHVRRLGDLTSGRLACVDEAACFAAFLHLDEPYPPEQHRGGPGDAGAVDRG